MHLHGTRYQSRRLCVSLHLPCYWYATKMKFGVRFISLLGLSETRTGNGGGLLVVPHCAPIEAHGGVRRRDRTLQDVYCACGYCSSAILQAAKGMGFFRSSRQGRGVRPCY